MAHFKRSVIVHKILLASCLLSTSVSLPTKGDYARKSFAQKTQGMKKLLKRGVSFFQKTSLEKACHEFAKNPQWRTGEVGIFVIDEKGTCYTFADENERVWTNFNNVFDIGGESFLHKFLTYSEKFSTAVALNNTFFDVWLRKVKKDGKTFILGVGFYPLDVFYIARGLVRRTIELIKTKGMAQTLDVINNRVGPLQRGDVYIVVTNKEGDIVGHGGETARIGQNIYNSIDKSGRAIINFADDLKKFLKSEKAIQTFSRQEKTPVPHTLNAYVNRYVDAKTNEEYAVIGIFLSDITQQTVKDIVNAAAEYFQDAKILDQRLYDLNLRREKFRLGRSSVSVFDQAGTVLAHGEMPELIGTNIKEHVDEAGDHPGKRMMEEALAYGDTWIGSFDKNAQKMFYAKRVDLPDSKLVVASRYWPPTKEENVMHMVENAITAIARYGLSTVCSYCIAGRHTYLQGDVYPTIMDDKGNILCAGPFNKHLMWKNINQLISHEDDILKKILHQASSEGKWIDFKKYGRPARAYVKSIEVKEIATRLIISSSYCL